jgi:hypothetical protein
MPERVVMNVYEEGSLTSVPGYASSITYHPNGLLNRLSHANGMVDTQEVDTSGMARPARISATGSQGSWTSGLYSYDGSGNIASIGGDVFVYDALKRLTSATLGTSAPGAVQSYTFDDFGNITHIVTGGSSRSQSVNARTNRLTAASYDLAGNQLSNGSGADLQQYQFDALGRLSTHQNTSDARGFVYTVGGGNRRTGAPAGTALFGGRLRHRPETASFVFRSRRPRATGSVGLAATLQNPSACLGLDEGSEAPLHSLHHGKEFL